MSANPSHIQQRRHARSKIPQTNYQTATDMTEADDRIELLVKDSNLTKHEVRTEDNKGDSHGHNWPTEDYVTENDTTVSHELRARADDIGRDLLDAFGTDTVTTPDGVGAPTARKHKFTPLDIAVSKQLPARTYVEIVGAGLDRLLPSMVCESLELKGQGSTHVSVSVSHTGSGKVTTPSGIAADDIEPVGGQHHFTNSMVKLVISDAGTLANGLTYGAANRLDNWVFRVKNNLLKEQGYVPGDELFQTAGDPKTGMIRSELLVESQDFELELYARFASQSDQLAALRSRKQLDALLALTGPTIAAAQKIKLAVNAPRVRYEMVELGEKDKVVHVQLKCKLFFDETLEYPASAELTNTITSYTA